MPKKGVDLPAPLPAGLDLEPKGNVTVIVSVPQIYIERARFGEEVRWSTINSNLPIYRDVGANILVAPWAGGVWEHIPYVDTITVKTSEGEVELKLWGTFEVGGGKGRGWVPKDCLKPDPHRGSEEEFLNMIETAHSLGIKVVPWLQVSYTLPGGFVYEEHPEWILKSIYGGYAVYWPWARAPWGFVLNKADPELIKYVTETIIPHWVKVWGVDGICLDSPPMAYCDPRVREICERVGTVLGCECLTPVDGYYTAEPLAKALREKFEQLEKETGRDLVCAAETAHSSLQDLPEEIIAVGCRANWGKFNGGSFTDPRVKGFRGKYWDWVCDYRFRSILKNVYDGGEYSHSKNFVNSFKEEKELESMKNTEPARFLNMVPPFHGFTSLHSPMVAECYITLTATAPGRVVWIGCYQLDTLPEKDVLRAWYKRLIKIKKAYPALQGGNIEDALLKPVVPRLIAYNRWVDDQPVSIIVNDGDQNLTATVKTRFQGREVHLIDLLHGDKIHGNPENLKVEMPPHTARVLIECHKGESIY